MTTTVKVNAHCDSSKTRVRIVEGSNNSDLKNETHLEDGEEQSFVVYDDKYLIVSEIPK